MCLVLAFGCAKKEDSGSIFSAAPSLTPAPVSTPAPEGGLEVVTQQGAPTPSAPPASPADGEEASATDAPPAPAVTVSATAAYVFEGMEGTTLYGAAAYENTGNCPVVITSAKLAFSVNGATIEREFTPVMADKTVVLPGETSFIAYWSADSAPAAGPAALTATLAVEAAEDDRITVFPKRIFLADNYPGFTTMSGFLAADKTCSLNLVYTGFYDESGALLGVWHFTKNAALGPEGEKSFAVHMRELPVDGLAERTAEVRTFGVGF